MKRRWRRSKKQKKCYRKGRKKDRCRAKEKDKKGINDDKYENKY